jgi:transposase
MTRFSTFVGLDVHKKTISIAFAERGGEKARFLRREAHDVTRLLRVLAPLGRPQDVQVCYEAGPTGYGLARRLREEGYDCRVVAPAKTPKKSSERVKTDRRDAIKLADYLRSGHLTSIRIPTPEEEALRDLIRAREDLKIKETNSKRQLNSMMLRHTRIFDGGKSLWTKRHFDWIETQEFDFEATREARDLYVGEIRRYMEALVEVDRLIEDISATMSRADLIHALRAFKGIKTLTAATIVAEVGDLGRFPSAAQFASFLGLTPSEHSSGDHRSRGAITKAGNRRLRRMLVEAAWAYWRSPHVSRELLARSEGVTQAVRDMSWRTQRRLHRRLRALHMRGKSPKKALVAIARELACSIWALGQHEALVKPAH